MLVIEYQNEAITYTEIYSYLDRDYNRIASSNFRDSIRFEAPKPKPILSPGDKTIKPE